MHEFTKMLEVSLAYQTSIPSLLVYKKYENPRTLIVLIVYLLKCYLFRLKLLTKRTCFRETPVRLVGLSTALANAGDVGEWLGIKDVS